MTTQDEDTRCKEVVLDTQKLARRLTCPVVELIPTISTYPKLFDLFDKAVVSSTKELLKASQDLVCGVKEVRAILRSNGNYTLDPTGDPFPYRGRGPVWSNNSCAFDSCIVAATFLNIGQTNWDRYNGADGARDALIGCVKTNWASLDIAESRLERRISLAAVLSRIKKDTGKTYKIGDKLGARYLWETCTATLDEFDLNFQDSTICSCGNKRNVNANANMQQALDYNIKDRKASIQEVLQIFFGPRQNRALQCPACKRTKAYKRRIVIGELPPRLVVTFQMGDTAIPEVESDNISFNYLLADDGEEETAYYKWLGGIYGSLNDKASHFRVYWNDGGEGDPQDTKMYCGMTCAGLIMGGIRYKDGQRVPNPWRRNPCLVFYKHVNVPECQIDLTS
ncbi:MAG: hypothetical protein M1834_001896 [Cirrosporium novae-zelandiae]|nr:MAG: hypothetical protein M1834_001896 [Cirrosporium novae-zelandiae]